MIGNKIDFDGIRLQIATAGLTEEAFQTVAAGETVEVEFDAAELHDLSTGGAVEIVTQGSFLYADADSTEIAGAVPFSSNSIKTEVNGEEAASVRTAFIEKRTAVQADCTGTRRTATVSHSSLLGPMHGPAPRRGPLLARIPPELTCRK